MSKTYRNRKTGKLVTGCEDGGVVYYYSHKDGKPYGPVRGKNATRFAELYEEVA